MVDQTKNINKFRGFDPNISAQPSWTKEWLDNGNFTLPIDPWYNETDGDTSDVNASFSDGYANFELLGDWGSFSTAEIYPNASGEWKLARNPDIPLLPVADPGDLSKIGAYIDTEGWWATHKWNQGPGSDHLQWASAQWRRDFNLPIDISDYEITSVDVEAIINATVMAYRAQSGGIDCPGDPDLQAGSNFDSANFYFKISNTANTTQYTLAYNKTKEIGLDSEAVPFGSDGWHYWSDKYMTVHNESILIAYLESVFQNAPDNKFSLILGIDMLCEDNEASDQDSWDDLRIKFANLSFTYEKKMDRYAAVSWNQEGNKIPDQVGGKPAEVNYANLTFQYKINKPWLGDRSPNSVLRVKINGFEHPIPIKLNATKTSFQDASFDVTTLMALNINITTSIEVFLLDNFLLNETFVISIDNAALSITYAQKGDVIQTEYVLFLNGDDKTSSSLIEITWGELVNITFVYRREDNKNFIDITDNGSVELYGYGSKKNFTTNVLLEYYNYTVDTTNLTIGENILTIIADRVWYETQEVNVVIKCLARDINYTIYLDGVDKTDDRYIALTAGFILNITVTLYDLNRTTENLENATVQIVNGLEWTENLTEYKNLKHYSIELNTTIYLDIGITFLALYIERENYKSYATDIRVTLGGRATYYDIKINGTDKTEEPSYEITIGYSFNITFRYYDNLTDNYLENATVRAIGGGINVTLEEDKPLQQYSAIINSLDFNAAINFVTIYAYLEDYNPQNPLLTIEVLDRETKSEIFINGLNITEQKFYKIPLGGTLNITIQYFDNDTKQHISGAEVELRHEGILLGELNESNQQYSLVINTISEGLDIGLRILVIEANAPNYQSQTPSLRIDVKQITGLIVPDERTIEALPGDDVKIKVELLNSDFGGYISGATVIFTSDIPDEDLKEGEFEEVKPGVYEFVLENVPEGTFTVTINVLGGGKYDNYDFKRIDVTVDVETPPEDVFWFQVLTIAAIIGAVALASYLIAYQKVLKYPKPVRKIHKTKKMLKKKKFKVLDIPNREAALKALYEAEFLVQARFLKPKIKSELPEKPLTKKLLEKPKVKVEKKVPAKKQKVKKLLRKLKNRKLLNRK